MTTREEALAFGLSYPDTCQDAPFHDPNWQLVRIKSSKKVFLWTYEKDGYINLNVKADPEWRDYWRSAFASVTAGYHLNKEHWSTIILDGTVPDDAIKNMIDESYRMVTDSPTKRIYEAVKKIPKGKVATYGQVAQMAGNPRMARAVGNALHKNPDPSTIPCHRVVNSKGATTSAFRPSSSVIFSTGRCSACVRMGRQMINSLPLPCAVCTSMVPPIVSTMFLVMAMPRPVP